MYIHIHTYTHIYRYIHAYIYINVGIHVCMFKYMYVCGYVDMYVGMFVCLCAIVHQEDLTTFMPEKTAPSAVEMMTPTSVRACLAICALLLPPPAPWHMP